MLENTVKLTNGISYFIKFAFFALIQLIFLIFISNNAYAIDYDLECPENKIVIVRTTNLNTICVYDSTAQSWVGMGNGLKISGDEPISKFPIRDAKNNEQKSDISPTVLNRR